MIRSPERTLIHAAGIVGLVVLVSATSARAQDSPPLGALGHVDLHHAGDCSADLENLGAPWRDAHLQATSPSFGLVWPFGDGSGRNNVVTGYFDHLAGPGVLDYAGGAWTYDGHDGTDIAVLSFRAMDQGVVVRAAHAGTVTGINNLSPFDRNCGLPPDPANGNSGNAVAINSGVGVGTLYAHLRSASITVELSETVQAGQMLGFAGASGLAGGPHLHFGVYDLQSGGQFTARDPWGGPQNPQPGLWNTQEPYAGMVLFRAVDLGVGTEAGFGGRIDLLSYCDVVDRLRSPSVLGLDEPTLDAWLTLQGQPSTAFSVEITRPNGTVFASQTDTLGDLVRFDIYGYSWPWVGHVTAADSGLWHIRVRSGSTTQKELAFRVGATTVFAPLFRRDGRSFRLATAAQRETLRVIEQSAPATFSLLDPAQVLTLSDSVLTIGTTSAQSERSLFFRVRAVDSRGRCDTAYFHVVDPTKPQGPLLVVNGLQTEPGLRLSVGPNPSTGDVVLHINIQASMRVAISLFDVTGRLCREWEPVSSGAGRLDVRWDGRDGRGRPVAPGVLTFLAQAGNQQRSIRFVRLKRTRE